MMDPEIQERIAARRAELDGLEEQLVKQLAEVRAERDALAVAELSRPHPRRLRPLPHGQGVSRGQAGLPGSGRPDLDVTCVVFGIEGVVVEQAAGLFPVASLSITPDAPPTGWLGYDTEHLALGGQR